MSRGEGYRIVVGIDLSERANRALDHALLRSNGREGAEVHVLHVSDLPSPAEDLWECVSARIGQVLPLPSARLTHVVVHRRCGRPAEEITRLARDLGARMIVVGSHGEGNGRDFLGSVARTVSDLAPCAVCYVDTTDRRARRFAMRRPAC